ncbi:MAG: tRNA pseudouridine(55) synthase TruB [Acidaminococcaceae bacterium]|jgi:tRNA pseudouridine55 synthase|nr:tRNA pseudouridine(55) synthase TruB [Acidaminococcaceae bacterium]MCI2110617.1 tRNA pseudouridine(55) synthase TruB [Acidaminococcaceae bacterium]
MLDGIYNVLKPPAMTSHDVVATLRKILNMKKIGHSGTLDPMAAGVLPVFVGKATKFLEYAVAESKTYRAEITFGMKTSTGDAEGDVIATSPVKKLEKETILKCLQSFLGATQQIPPMYSAINYKGQKLYKLARKGIEVERQPRNIFIYKLDLLDYAGATMLVDVVCSKGTFIRTLAEDIAGRLGMEGTMSFLLRRQVGRFTLDNAHTLEEIAADQASCILPWETAIMDFPVLTVNPLQGRRIAQGVPTTLQNITEGTLYKLVTTDGLVLGLALAKDGKVRGHKIVNIPQEVE